MLGEQAALVCDLARLKGLELLEEGAAPPSGAARGVAQGGAEVFLPLEGLVDVDVERERLGRALAKVDKELARVEGKLNNPRFVERAPDEVVGRERRVQAELSDRKSKLEGALAALVAVGA